MAYTFSIIAITLLCFFYLRYKLNFIKFGLLFDVFLTLSLVFDTINYYTRMIVLSKAYLIKVILIYGLLFANIGFAYFLALFTHEVIQKRFERKNQLLFLTTSLLALIAPILLRIFRINGVITEGIAQHTGFFLSNIFSSFWGIYFTTLFVGNVQKLDKMIRPLAVAYAITIFILAPLSVFTNVLLCFIHIPFPVAYSPIISALTNLLILLLIKCSVKSLSVPSDTPSRHKSHIAPDWNQIAGKYNLTERELEIIKLVSKGHSNQEIGSELFISANTVKNHLYNAFRKLGIKSRYELMNIIAPDLDEEIISPKIYS